MKRQLTYTYGGRALTDCPLCGQAARVDRRGAKLSIRCYTGCDEAEVLAAFKRNQKQPPPNAEPIRRLRRG